MTFPKPWASTAVSRKKKKILSSSSFSLSGTPKAPTNLGSGTQTHTHTHTHNQITIFVLYSEHCSPAQRHTQINTCQIRVHTPTIEPARVMLFGANRWLASQTAEDGEVPPHQISGHPSIQLITWDTAQRRSGRDQTIADRDIMQG